MAISDDVYRSAITLFAISEGKESAVLVNGQRLQAKDVLQQIKGNSQADSLASAAQGSSMKSSMQGDSVGEHDGNSSDDEAKGHIL
eukprot:1816256-Amphidinium_carterae.1